MRLSFTLLILLTSLILGTAQDIKSTFDFINLEPFEMNGKIKGIGIVATQLRQQYYHKNSLCLLEITTANNELWVKSKQKNFFFSSNNDRKL
jgi:hypothetical protein